ncbi:carboxymuconolactone decarboxylase family protein [Actinophytocola sp.]|uniref:carboxymuconolactone decarboxylase family protein n=1 Tax=Actinophytocola sp. TaxID=1872138 RepID=UPI002D801D4A|nr:carboxymuconolactone decarboxylase family protein [Actinophytocola sp.]HET9139348.1 carboxymuconolactone decarboxylase family protein [Actinophytocola sp.]HEU5109884.1 carboxymuconolactone decarboxylase family protein [Micromonosporaceae bacterium]
MTEPRIPPLAPSQQDEQARQLLSGTGSSKNIFTTLVRHPKLFEVFTRFAGRLLLRSGLPEHDRETLILRTAYRCRAAYEWAQHVEIARGIGLAEDVITAAGSEHPEPADPHVALLLAAADQLSVERDLDDATWSALAERYDERQLIELCLLVGNYGMIAGVLNALRVPLEDGQSAPGWA